MKIQKQFEFEWKRHKKSPEIIEKVKQVSDEYDAKLENLEFQKDIDIDNATAALTEELTELLKQVSSKQEQRRTLAQLVLNRIDRERRELKEEKYTKLLDLLKSNK